MMANESLNVNGVKVWKGLLSRAEQSRMLDDLRGLAGQAPFRRYRTPTGEMSVRMSGAGAQSWYADAKGYRYEPFQPDGRVWPDIPSSVLAVWQKVAGVAQQPDSCLINFYGEGAKMGMHQDKDEESPDWPVVSISLGDEALFRVGQTTRKGPTQSIWLQSGDVAVLDGPARLAYHGIDRIKFGSSSLLPDGGRINITLRVAGSSNSQRSDAERDRPSAGSG